MARYFFHLRERSGDTVDEEGLDLIDDEAARQVAIAGARSIISSEVVRGRLHLTPAIEVTDADGQTVVILSFSEAVQKSEGG
jgi:hypothetical protein